ncbi:hypothetical protein EVAR_19108_1 [Eumeta japonica]|uniref:Uncharacterized protein n=1 Tax=Eumeta variegata TaxID=151549 RepID=A0A4C1UQC6_EUMVA|nr:hypothetical protein EVAR_19108_1 [Eumeta japonica]
MPVHYESLSKELNIDSRGLTHIEHLTLSLVVVMLAIQEQKVTFGTLGLIRMGVGLGPRSTEKPSVPLDYSYNGCKRLLPRRAVG